MGWLDNLENGGKFKEKPLRTPSESTGVKKPLINKRELKNIKLDLKALKEHGSIDKPKAEANKVEKFLPDENTKKFFKKAKDNTSPSEYMNLVKIQHERGNPSVNIGTDKGLPFAAKKNYNPFTNEINIPETKLTPEDISNYIGEVSHAGQPLSEVIPKFITRDIPAYANEFFTGGPSPYETEGTVEHTTHDVIQPQLMDQFQSLNPNYKTFRGIPQAMWDNPQYLNKRENGGYLGTTNKGFNYNGAWGGPAQDGTLIPYSNEYMDDLENKYKKIYNDPNFRMDDGYDEFYHSMVDQLPDVIRKAKGWVEYKPGTDIEEFTQDNGRRTAPIPGKGRLVKRVEDYKISDRPDTSEQQRLTRYIREKVFDSLDNRNVSTGQKKQRDGGWLDSFQDGGFLQPDSEKLPEGYVIPFDRPSSELAMSIGGEEGEPAYLIPTFKYGKPLYDPVEEYQRTGENLGGPFKTWEEADKWEREVRHPKVENKEKIQFPIEEFQMGGSMPGSVGFSYARTGAPSNGPHAKKTMASAQNGLQELLKSNKKTALQQSIDKEQQSENFRRLTETKKYQDAVKAQKAKVVSDRKERIKKADANPLNQWSTEAINPDNWTRENLAEATGALQDKFKLFPDDPNSIVDEFLNPLNMIGGMASNLGSAPLRDLESDSVMPLVMAMGMPLGVGALGSIGTGGSNMKLANNLFNPLEQIPGYGAVKNKISNIAENFPLRNTARGVENIGQEIRNVGEISPDVSRGVTNIGETVGDTRGTVTNMEERVGQEITPLIDAPAGQSHRFPDTSMFRPVTQDAISDVIPSTPEVIPSRPEITSPDITPYDDVDYEGAAYDDISPDIMPLDEDLINQSTVGVKNDFIRQYGEDAYNNLLKEQYALNQVHYDNPTVAFKGEARPLSFYKGFGGSATEGSNIWGDLNKSSRDQGLLFKEKFCEPGSECAKSANAVANRTYTDITGEAFRADENAHNAWHTQEQMERHGGVDVTNESPRVGDRVLMGNATDQSTYVPGFTADPTVRHAGTYAGVVEHEGELIPSLFESGKNNPMYLNPTGHTFTGENTVKKSIRPEQFIDDTFGEALVDKNIRYAFRDKPSIAKLTGEHEAAQQVLTGAEKFRETIKKTHDITNDEFDELVGSLVGIGAQETKLGGALPGSKLAKAKIALQDGLNKAGLTKPIKQAMNLVKRGLNKATAVKSDLPAFPGASMLEMEAAKLSQSSNVPFEEALATVKGQYQPRPKFTPSTVEPSKGMFRQKFQTEADRLAGLQGGLKGKNSVENAMGQMSENYQTIKSLYPEASPRELMDLTTLMWNSPGKAKNKELVDFFLMGKDNPDPTKFSFDYIRKINEAKKNLINIQPGETPEPFFEFFRGDRPEIQYQQGGVINDDMGQWAHPGEVTRINSNDITMEDVPYDVLGISNKGQRKIMKPGGQYKFNGSSVTEYPLGKNGKELTKLDQLTNFTNYNTPQPGGWLDNI